MTPNRQEATLLFFTNYGELDPCGLPADLTQAEANKIAKAKWNAMMDVFDERMERIAALRDTGQNPGSTYLVSDDLPE